MTKEQILNTRLTEEQIAMFYLGQEGFLIRYRDHFYLIDPYLSDSIDRHHGMQDADWTRRYDILLLRPFFTSSSSGRSHTYEKIRSQPLYHKMYT